MPRPRIGDGVAIRGTTAVSGARLWLGLFALTVVILGAVGVLDRHGQPWRPPAEQPFRPSSLVVDGTSIAGIRIGEPIGAVVADAGRPTVLDAAVPAIVGPVEQRAEWNDADVYYDVASHTVTSIDVLFSDGVRTSRGDTFDTPIGVVRAHYPRAVPYQSTCARQSENLLLRTRDANYVLDLWFVRHRLRGATLISWPKFTAACWLLHDRRPTPNPLA
jgi:hypothetical protein